MVSQKNSIITINSLSWVTKEGGDFKLLIEEEVTLIELSRVLNIDFAFPRIPPHSPAFLHENDILPSCHFE